MPLTRIRTDDLLSGSVANGTLNATAITGQAAATSADDADLVLIYDDGASALKKMTRANFTAGLSTTLSGAYDAGRFITASNGAVDIQVSSNTNAPTELLRLVVSGNVNGTDSGPRLSFHVPYSDTAYIGAAIDGIKSQTSENNSTTEFQFSTSDNNQTLSHNVTINTNGLAVAGTSATVPTLGSEPHAFYVATTGDGSALTVKNSNGYVGIGETSPDYNLHISSTGDAAIFIEADTDNSGEADNPFIKLSQDNTAVQSIIGLCGATDKDPENNTYTGVVNNNMLIGTTTNYGLQIGTNDNVRITVENDGDIKLVSTKDDTTSSSANLFINSSTGFLARSTSDRRQKKDITAISSSLDDLCRLSPRHFYDVNDENNEVRIAGFVADEVQPVFPELVPERDLPDEIYRSVAYDRLGAYIVSAIKEIKQRLEALEGGS